MFKIAFSGGGRVGVFYGFFEHSWFVGMGRVCGCACRVGGVLLRRVQTWWRACVLRGFHHHSRESDEMCSQSRRKRAGMEQRAGH